jgi:3-oxoacyl-[acyl-carrier protein] reductase
MDFEFTDRVAIVTGASHGIGGSICAELARRGARVYAGDVLDHELEQTVAACREAGGGCEGRRLDVTDDASVAAFVGWVREAAGRVDILVNVAGGVMGQTHKPIESVSDADWNAVIGVNLTGTFHLARAVAPLMKEQRYGRIVNISSGAGRSTSLTGIQAYTSAKAGQIGLTRQLAQELGPWNITVNAIAPGFVRSNPSTEKQWDSYGPEKQQALVESIALRRTGRAEDIAYGVLFFASDYAAWCSGQVISIDGGHSMF